MEYARTAPSALNVSGLVKEYPGGRGVHDVGLSVAAGSVVGFIGANGAGKSTTLKCIVGLLEPDRGAVELFGERVNFQRRQRLGYLPEERGIAPKERARDVVAFHARLKGFDAKSAYRAADRLLERIGLEGRTRARICELSKGNAQRVQILCAIAHNPDLLILDEPFSGLDPIAQAEVQSLFSEYRSEGGAILFSTHSMASAERLCDEVVIVSDGRTAFQGPVEAAATHAEHGVFVTCGDEAGLLLVVRKLGGEAHAFPGKMGEALRWRVVLPTTVPYPALMRAMAEAGLPVQGFEPMRADLESAFWSLSTARREAA